MKPDKIIDSISFVDDMVLEKAAKLREKRSARPLIIKLSAVAACIAVLVSALLFMPQKETVKFSNTGKAFAMEAVYPEQKQDGTLNYDNENTLKKFSEKINKELLINNKENFVYSPLNIYFAMTMLAECTEGDSKAELLEFIGEEDLVALRKNAYDLWLNNYIDSEDNKTRFGNSVWLNKKILFDQNALKILNENYFASVYSGKMGDKAYFNDFKNWLNKQTNNLLTDSVNTIPEWDAETAMCLASTLYFKSNWQKEFPLSVDKPFYTNNGQKTTKFLLATDYRYFYESDNFTATAVNFSNGGNMLFVLPNENSSVEDVAKNEKFYELICTKNKKAIEERVCVQVPEFDISAHFRLSDCLPKLGVKDIFSPSKANFSKITKEQIYVDLIMHSARVKIDKYGCEGAAFTITSTKGTSAAVKDDPIEFILDRPFIFVVRSHDNSPLFIGAVYNP